MNLGVSLKLSHSSKAHQTGASRKDKVHSVQSLEREHKSKQLLCNLVTYKALSTALRFEAATIDIAVGDHRLK